MASTDEPDRDWSRLRSADQAEFTRRVAMATLEADHQTLELEARITATTGGGR